MAMESGTSAGGARITLATAGCSAGATALQVRELHRVRCNDSENPPNACTLRSRALNLVLLPSIPHLYRALLREHWGCDRRGVNLSWACLVLLSEITLPHATRRRALGCEPGCRDAISPSNILPLNPAESNPVPSQGSTGM